MSFCSRLIANFCNASRTAAPSAASTAAVDLELATKATSPTKTIAHAIATPLPSMLLRFFIRASPVRRYTGLVELNKCFKTFRGLANRMLANHICFGGKIEQDFEVTNKNVVRWHGQGVNSRDRGGKTKAACPKTRNIF